MIKTVLVNSIMLLAFAAQAVSAEKQKSVAVETSRVRSELVSPAIWVPGTVISR